MRSPLRHPMLWAIVIAIALGFALGWYAHVRYVSTPEERAREAAREIEEKVRGWTR